jgi:Neocarzinostatin family
MARTTGSRLGRGALALGAALLVVFTLGAPAGAADPTPSAAVTPDTGLVDGQTVTVSITGFLPGEELNVSRCGNPAPCVQQDDVHAGTDGAAVTTLTLVRSLTDGHVPPIDCAATPGACVVNVSSLDGSRRVVVPLTFDPDGPRSRVPTLSVHPAAGLVDGQSVSVTASGFAPGAHLDYGVCLPGPFDISGCDVMHAQFAIADASGGFRGSVTVTASITIREAGLDCTVAPGTCVFTVADANDFSVHAGVPLTFGSPPSPPHHGDHRRPPPWWHRGNQGRDDHHSCHRS